jgi:hypothetical protein
MKDSRPPVTPLRSRLHKPLWRFCGSHEDIRGGLDRLRQVPALAVALREAREAARAVQHLFDEQVIGHHVDEEEELFVAVQRSARGSADEARVAALVAQLTREHRAVEKAWSRLRPAVCAIAAGKPPAAPGLEQEVGALVHAYFLHAQLEDEEFLPLADAILSRDPNHMAALDLSLHMRDRPVLRAAHC